LTKLRPKFRGFVFLEHGVHIIAVIKLLVGLLQLSSVSEDAVDICIVCKEIEVENEKKKKKNIL